jgi:hypothetical protein
MGAYHKRQMFERVDLHTHSHYSDGVLAPAALIALAAQRKVGALALTDHDTSEGCAEAAAACAAHGIVFIPGIEFTAGWRGQEIHIVGLGIDTAHPALHARSAELLTLRRARIAAIGQLLSREKALAGEDIATSLLQQPGVPTRLHLARELHARGLANDLQDAFDRWLGRKRPGHVPQQWPGIEGAIDAIVAAGGIAVLAHAHRYKFSNGVLGQLCAAFKAAGGRGIEVSLPGTSPADTARLLRQARLHGLAGSVGSDFHQPGFAWRPVGRFAKLPDDIAPVLAQLLPQ